MEYKTYLLQPFNSSSVKNGKLCVVTKYGYSGGAISTDSADFIAAGIPTVTSPTTFVFNINDVDCIFDERGIQKYSNGVVQFQLLLGNAEMAVQQYGNVIRRAKKVTTIRTDDGVKTVVEDYTPRKSDDELSKNVLISTLNARDNFALNALQCIIATIPDVKNVGDNERDFYCKLAYQWAANMMDNAAQVRATFEDETHSTEQSTDITELETNTDKLLNNILFTMEKVQQTTIDGEHQIVSDRIVNPELNSRIDKLEAAIKAQTTVFNTAMLALTTAINNQTTALNNQNTTLGQIKTAIENLELSPTINNNIVVPEPTPDPEPSNNTEEK